MSKKNESSKSVKIRPYVEIGLGVSWLAMMVAGGLYAFLACQFMSAIPICIIVPVGLVVAVGALLGTLEFFFKLDHKQHKKTGYRHVSMPYGC